MRLPGFGETTEQCRRVKYYYSCPDGHVKIPVRDSCQRVECPNCWVDWASKASHRVSDRLRGVRSFIYHNSPGEYKKVKRIRHFTFSPPSGVIDESMGLEDVKRCWRRFARSNVSLCSGAVVYHPYRIRDDVERRLAAYMKRRELSVNRNDCYEDGGYWALVRADVLDLGGVSAYVEFSPHFHVLGSGWLPNSSQFYAQTGWVYKNLGQRHLKITISPVTGGIVDEIGITMKYLLSHSGVEPTPTGRYRQSYWYFGYASPKNSRLVRSESGSPVNRLVVDSVLVCPVCGRPLCKSFLDEQFVSSGPNPYWEYLDGCPGMVKMEEVCIRRVYRSYEVKVG